MLLIKLLILEWFDVILANVSIELLGDFLGIWINGFLGGFYSSGLSYLPVPVFHGTIFGGDSCSKQREEEKDETESIGIGCCH